jgi:glutamine amidotransferase
MCEILGISSGRVSDVAPILRQFYPHSVEHPDGWGLATIRGANLVSVEKEPKPAFLSDYLRERLSAPLYASTVLGHIRKASVGRVEYVNCHPFALQDNYGRCWTMVHNGTVFNGAPLSKYQTEQEGSTDSERILYALVDQINRQQTLRRRKLHLLERFRLLEKTIAGLTEGNRLNLLIYDGDLMYVHANIPGRLYVHHTEGQTIFSTTPLWESGWEPLPLCTLFAYRDGGLLRAGQRDGHAYQAEPLEQPSLIDYAAL